MERTLELQVLHIIILFDRPATAEALAELRRLTPIPILNERLPRANDWEWFECVQRLRELGLLAPAALPDLGIVEAHPIIREHFGTRLRTEYPKAWRAAHSRLSGYFFDRPRPR